MKFRMMGIEKNLQHISSNIPEHVTLVAVSKTKPNSDIMEAYSAGQRVFGENYVQEMVEKHAQMPKDIQWHFIGHLQSNKVKYIAPFVSLIHGIDSLKLLKEIDKQAKKNNRIIDCLLQMHIAEEDSKFGLSEEELDVMLKQLLDCARSDNNEFQNIKVIGLMGMATFTNDEKQIKKEFQYLKSVFDKHKQLDPSESEQAKQTSNLKLETLSMGMSSDYRLAIECGSTMVRIGSSIFGSRSPQTQRGTEH